MSTQLQHQLEAFTGTEEYHRHPLNRRLIYTDGVDHFCEFAEAYWFLDLIGLGIGGNPGIVPEVIPAQETFGVLFLHSKDGKGLVEVYDDVPGRCLYSEFIEFTTCPEGVWKFYVIDDGQHVTVLLPSEY